jgi:multisubunit Na+/H+ antiporter MnhF subunit
MQVIHISCHVITIYYKNLKMINLTYMIFILNFVFTIVVYMSR